jgi:hypothetical protein
MAQEAGFVVDEKAQQHQPNCIFHTHHMVDELLERFAALVASERDIHWHKIVHDECEAAIKEEREACAKVCEFKMPNPVMNWSDAQIVETLRNCAAVIRQSTSI